MKKRLGILLTMVALLVFGYYIYNQRTAPITVEQPQVVQSTTLETIEPPTASELLKLTNIERKKAGVQPLRLDDRLNQSAQWKADDMDSRNYYEHEDPKTGRRNGLDKITSLIKCYRVGENIVGRTVYSPANESIQAWVGSKSHYEAMVDSKYDLVGFGSNNNYVVQHFCEP